MQKTIERTRLLLLLEKYSINIDFVKKYSYESLMNCISVIEKSKIPAVLYRNYDIVQEELMTNEAFPDFLSALGLAEMHGRQISGLLAELRAQKEKITDYHISRVIKTLKEGLPKSFDFLKYFSHKSLSQGQESLIIQNLLYCYRKDGFIFSGLCEEERNLFYEPFISCSRLIPVNQVETICGLLIKDKYLLNIVRFLFEKEIIVSLDSDDYLRMCKGSDEIYCKLVVIFARLSGNAGIMTQLMSQWRANGCTAYELQILERKIYPIPEEELNSVFETRAGYINLIFGSRIKNIPLSDEPGYREDILIYAVTHKKNNFIKLAEDNYDVFASIPPDSVLFQEEFYRRYVNINSLNVKNLKACKKLILDRQNKWDINVLTGSDYTFEEIGALFGKPAQYARLYDGLALDKVDERLIVIRQITKKGLLPPDIEDACLSRLAHMLSCKPLSVWLEKDFSHILGLKSTDAVQILISYESVKKFLPQMTERCDVLFVIQNLDNIQGYSSLSEIKDNCEAIDNAWLWLRETFKLDAAFSEAHKNHIVRFLMKNSASIVQTYYKLCESDNQRESFKRIVKAELHESFYTLKYFQDDLIKEIAFDITGKQRQVWTENGAEFAYGINIEECDDFYATMQIGILPQRTCLSYIDGEYSECLLSCFDSNKKILYASVGGKVVGRAIIRLTKGLFKIPSSSEKKASFSFVDIDAVNNTLIEEDKDNIKDAEWLALFLERPYVASVNPETEERVKALFIKYAEKKADSLGAAIVLSDDYESPFIGDSYVRTRCYIYISKSKAGVQYLDSLDGSATVQDEETYKSNSFYIRRNEMAEYN